MSMHTEVTTPSDREVVITRRFAAPRQVVWDCHTKPELVRQWLLGPAGWTMPVCEIDLRVDGRYRYVWRRDSGEEMGLNGVYREIAAPARLVANESFDDDWTAGATLATTEFDAQGRYTTVTVTVVYASMQARDGALRTGMTQGVEQTYSRLDELLAAREP